MNNLEKLTQELLKKQKKDILIHTIPGAQLWLIAEPINKQQILLKLIKPYGNITYNLKIISYEECKKVWMHLINMQIDKKIQEIERIKLMKNTIKYLLKKDEKTIKYLLKNKGRKN